MAESLKVLSTENAYLRVKVENLRENWQSDSGRNGEKYASSFFCEKSSSLQVSRIDDDMIETKRNVG